MPANVAEAQRGRCTAADKRAVAERLCWRRLLRRKPVAVEAHLPQLSAQAGIRLYNQNFPPP